MLRFEDSAEEVAYDDRSVKAQSPRRRKVSKPGKAKAPRAPRPQNPLGIDAKSFNDEIPDPDSVVPE